MCINHMNLVDQSSIPENAVVLDYEDEIKVENLPDTNYIIDCIIDILEYMGTVEMVKLRGENIRAFESVIESKFSEFANSHYGTFRMILSGSDLAPLVEMLRVIDKMKTREVSVDDGEKEVGSHLKKFLPPELRKM